MSPQIDANIVMLSTRHHHPTVEHDCDICGDPIPIGARAVRVGFSQQNRQSPSGARSNYTHRYHNRCWVQHENEIKAGNVPKDAYGSFGQQSKISDLINLSRKERG